MKLLMLSGDRDTVVGARGPFYAMQEAFSKHWERIDVLCPKPAGAVLVTTIHGRVHFHPSPVGRARAVGYLVTRGGELLREQRHDVIVSHDYGTFYNGRAAARLAAATETPWMSEIFHVPGIPRAASWRERIDPWLTRRYVGFALRRGVGAFRVMNHRETPPFLRSCGVPEDKIRFLSALYLDLDTFRPAPAAEKKWDVAFVARMVPNKGAGVVLDALGALRRERPALRARFVGKGPMRPDLESRARALGLEGAVEFVDWLDGKGELADLYRASRLLVCASLNEGGPRVTCEAMACGTPVVSTPIGVMPDLIRHRENGWIFGFDARSLESCLREALTDGAAYARAAASCREAVLPFEYHKTIAAYAAGLQALAREKRGAAA
jgi:glycosyltransferase involved in cell wall biosynthesis